MGKESDYTLATGNTMADAMRSIVDHELNYSRTVTFSSLVDLTAIESIRNSLGADRPSYTAIVAKALSLALRDFPYANQRIAYSFLPFLLGTRRQKFKSVDISIFVERESSDVANVTFIDTIRDVDHLTISEINHELRRLASADAETNGQWATFQKLIRLRPG